MNNIFESKHNQYFHLHNRKQLSRHLPDNFPLFAVASVLLASLTSALQALPGNAAPSPSIAQPGLPTTQAAPSDTPTLQAAAPQATPMSQQQIIQKINELEIQLMILKRAAGADLNGQKIVLPKKGIYVQGEIGAASRDPAYENQTTMTTFDPGLYGGVALGYRYDRNFRFSFNYSAIDNAANKISPGIPIPVVDPIIGPVGVDGAQFPAAGNIRLDSYTLNVYYDLNGFGYERRFRPYIGAGVGLQTSTISGLQPAFFPSIGVNRSANASSTSPVLKVEAGLSYLFNPKTEFYIGGEYSYVTDYLFENTAFGTLVPNGSRNWIIKTGARYTF